MLLLEQDTEIYRDRDALREDCQPEKPVGRGEGLRIFQTALQPVINGEQPNNVLLYGRTGVGKTAAPRYLPGHLHENASHYDDIHLTVTFLNRDELMSSYQIATRLVNEFWPESNQISVTGYPLGSAYEIPWQELDNCGGTIIIVPNEIDHVNGGDILYQPPWARANGNLNMTKVGLIDIFNDSSFRDDPSLRVRSSLCERETHFPTYSTKNPRAILERRAKVTSREDVPPDGVTPSCTAYGAKDAEDAHQSIDLLMEAGDLARGDDTDHIEEEHVKRSRCAFERGRIKEGTSGLTEHGHLVLYSLLTSELEDETPIRFRDVRSRYARLAELANRDPFVPWRMRDHLSELAMLGIVSITERNEGRRGGAYREYALDIDIGLIIPATHDTIELISIYETVEPFFDGDKMSTLGDFIER